MEKKKKNLPIPGVKPSEFIRDNKSYPPIKIMTQVFFEMRALRMMDNGQNGHLFLSHTNEKERLVVGKYILGILSFRMRFFHRN